MDKTLVVKNLTKVYGYRSNSYKALNGIEFEMSEGEFLGIMGPSGAGKTTLLNIIATIDKKTSGEITYGEENIDLFDENKLTDFRRNNLGFVFQDYNLLDTLTLWENIALPLSLSRINIEIINTRVASVSKIFSIDHVVNKYPSEVSGGEKQRTAAARAIISNPHLVLADEPTGALDMKSSIDFLNILNNINKSDRVSIMMVTHDAFVASYCTRILFLKDGEIYNELIKANQNRNEFHKKILLVLERISSKISD